MRFEEVELESATFTAPAWDRPATLSSQELDQQRNRKYPLTDHLIVALIQITVHSLFAASVACFGAVRLHVAMCRWVTDCCKENLEYTTQVLEHAVLQLARKRQRPTRVPHKLLVKVT